jgi:outer membrane immunogenic protein
MIKLAAHVTAISLACAGYAVAADMRMPVKGPAPVMPVAGYNWTGCYLGAGGGYGLFDQQSRYVTTGQTSLSNDNGGRGWFGTVQVGCDYQISSGIVIGAFADYDFSGIKGNMAVPDFGFVGQEKLQSSWAAGGRIGWLPSDQLLVYVSGGYTEARFSQVNFSLAATGLQTVFGLPKHTYSGWFVGSGYEYGLGWMPGLFWKTEYRFADYGSDTLPIVVSATGAPRGDNIESRKYVQTIRSELVWRFNFGGPVAARY